MYREKYFPTWKNIIQLYISNANVGFARCVVSDFKVPITLHMFTDASCNAFGAVCYIVTMGKNPTSNNLCSKSKIKPLGKKLTIPKLELSGVLLGLELIKNLIDNKDEVNFESVHLWADALCVLN